MQEVNDTGPTAPSDAEAAAQHQQLLALTAFCHSQMPRVKVLHDNVARVYGKAGGMPPLLLHHSLASSQFPPQRESCPAGPVKRLRQAQRQRRGKLCSSRAHSSPAQQQPGAFRCAVSFYAFALNVCASTSAAAGGLKRVRAAAPDENLLICNENMGDET